jgi:two-component system, NtrC family, sensor histidine kinase PilS
MDAQHFAPSEFDSAPANLAGLDRDWRPLYYFNLYRATLAGLFCVLAFWGGLPRPLGQADADLFSTVVVVYLTFSVVSIFTIRFRWLGFGVQIFAQVLADIVAIALLMHASGGVASGFGMLLVAAIAGGSILTQGRIAILFAAMASLAVLAEQVYSFFYQSYPVSNYAQVGALGVTFFATASLAHVLARRIRTSEALAAQRGMDLANLAQLNDHIIQRMQSGILAVDRQGGIRLINESARVLLGLSAAPPEIGRLDAAAPELYRLMSRWRDDRFRSSTAFQPKGGPVQVMASFAGLEGGRSGSVLIFLEDASAMHQRAQQLKLASLGRLTASIAHEIRNPLGAVSHAAQLLDESDGLVKGDRRLTQIVQDNCNRMNVIVENILQLSRRRATVPESVALKGWLEAFVKGFSDDQGVGVAGVVLEVIPPDLSVRMDPSQLHQILWNLCENGVRHGGEMPELRLRAGIDEEIGRPFLEISDNGPGIPPDLVDQVFEPLFTTSSEGTGMGLYIARELCESNRASLKLVPRDGGCCFRILFTNPLRQEWD